MTVVIDVSSQFLEDGLVAYEVSSDGDRNDWEVEEGGLSTDIPLVVLVNGGSASGAEVVAGAIQAQGRGQLVGTQTFGKGVVIATRIPLGNGGGLNIPVATWFTPAGKQIGQIGLTPDVEVLRTVEDIRAGRDPQMEAALGLLREAQVGQG